MFTDFRKFQGIFDWLVFSAASKVIATTTTFPYQVLRTRMQVNNFVTLLFYFQFIFISLYLFFLGPQCLILSRSGFPVPPHSLVRRSIGPLQRLSDGEFPPIAGCCNHLPHVWARQEIPCEFLGYSNFLLKFEFLKSYAFLMGKNSFWAYRHFFQLQW